MQKTMVEREMKRQEGFTLVELSMVLVAIGLLIGGILAAQSMIQTARIQALVKQIGQFDAAEENFQTKFGQLPGDTNLMGNSLGNNDGTITGTGTHSSNWSGEEGKFWSDLSKNGFMNPVTGNNYPDNSSGATDITVNTSSQMPQSALGSRTYFMAIGYAGQNYYIIGGTPQNGTNNWSPAFNAPYTPAQSLALDAKIDDSLANSGNIKASDNVNLPQDIGGSGYIHTYGSTCSTASGGANYKTSVQTATCLLAIRIGTSTGDLK